jgi:hypothetical protein
VLFPLSLSHLDFRSVFPHGVSVAAYKSSPAYAAFEDAKESYASEFEIPDRGQILAAGKKFDYKTAQTLPHQRVIAMKGMTVRAPAQQLETKPIYVAGQSIRPGTPGPAAIAAVSTYHIDPQDDALSVGTASLPVPRQIGNSARFASSRTIRTASGASIVVARADQPPAPAAPTPKDSDYSFVAGMNPVLPAGDMQRPLWLDGQLEMTGGLAFVGPETQLLVKRVVNGSTIEKGRIWITEGKFEIRVKQATGYLVAELFTRDGRVLGRGELNLTQLNSVASNSDRIDDLRIALRPTTDTASMRTVSDNSPVNSPAVIKEARVEIQNFTDPQPVNDEGFMSEPQLAAGSTFVARATAKKHWSTIVVGQAGRPQDIRLFSNSLIEALININFENGTDRAEAYHMGVIWGQISRDGEPVAGAQAELAGDYKPIYFNEAYIPDRSMTATGKNGLFAFLRVRSGVQAVRVKTKGRVYPAQVFPTEDKHVSYLELELRDKVVSQFKVLDVLDMNKPVSARIRLVGTDAMMNMANDQYAEYSVAANTFMIEADAGPEYELSRTTLNGSPHLVHVPLVKREWLRGLAGEKDIAPVAGRGTVVGFIDDQDFEVEMTGYPLQEQPQVVYFDAQGRTIPGNTGIAGGGFAIFNAPGGLQTVYVHPVQSRAAYSQVVVAEPEYVHVLAWSAASGN